MYSSLPIEESICLYNLISSLKTLSLSEGKSLNDGLLDAQKRKECRVNTRARPPYRSCRSCIAHFGGSKEGPALVSGKSQDRSNNNAKFYQEPLVFFIKNTTHALTHAHITRELCNTNSHTHILNIRRRSKNAPWRSNASHRTQSQGVRTFRMHALSRCTHGQGRTHVQGARTFRMHARSGCTQAKWNMHDNNARMQACTQLRDRSLPIALRHAHSRCMNKERSRCTHARLNVHGTPTVHARTLISALTHVNRFMHPPAPPAPLKWRISISTESDTTNNLTRWFQKKTSPSRITELGIEHTRS